MKPVFRRRASAAPIGVSLHEQHVAEGEATLVRVAGTWDPGAAPRLVASSADGEQTFELLPGSSPDGAARAAYAVPPAALGGAKLTLRVVDGVELDLPAPDVRTLAPVPKAERAAGDAASVAAHAERLAEELRARCAISERELKALRAGAREDGSSKLVAAWGEAAELRSLLDEREEVYRGSNAEVERLRRRESELRAAVDQVTSAVAEWRDKMLGECERLTAELAARDGSVEEARAAVDEAERRAAVHEAESSDLARRLDEANGEAARLRQELKQVAGARAHAEAELPRLRDEVESVAARAAAAEQRATDAEARLDAEQAKLAAAEERIRVLEAHAAEASRLRAKLDKAERSGARRHWFARGATDSDAAVAKARGESRQLEARLAALADELRDSDERHRGEIDRLSGEVAELEQQLAKQQTVEEDLRALLASERRQAAEARDAADGLRGRLSHLPSGGDADAGECPTADAPWSAMDDELLARLERAKALSGT